MILKQYYLGCLAHASYLIGDESTGSAVVVDPRRDVAEYQRDAAEEGLRIEHVILTHFHADFVAGHLELRDALGAEIHLGARGQAEYAVTPAHDGDELVLGPNVKLRFWETPGHTPEGICVLAYERGVSDEVPHAVLTGDTLFIGDVGRPDLVASQGVSAEELAGDLYDSLHSKLLTLPDETLVYPAHGAGSLCGRNLSSDTVSTIGAQRTFNYALAPMSREEFIRMATADLPPAPAYFGYDALLNRTERPTTARQPAVPRLDLDGTLRAVNAGAQLLDVRDAMDFGAAHVRGAINVGLGGAFAQWAGAVLDPARPIVLLVYPGGEQEAATRLARVGFDRVIGYLSTGMQALEERDDLVGWVERIAAANLAEALEGDGAPFVLDVRNPAEFGAGHLPGAVNIPLPALTGRMDEVPAGRTVAVYCASGYRSSVAASLLLAAGREVEELQGGYAAWTATHQREVA
jgi:hydroxyacylglutathione hydrolase